MAKTGSAPPVTEDQQVKAAWYLHRTGNADLWGVLGLDAVVERRRRALGLTTRGAVLEDPACPTCGAAAGDRCRSDRGGVLHGRHMARRRLAGRIDNTEGD